MFRRRTDTHVPIHAALVYGYSEKFQFGAEVYKVRVLELFSLVVIQITEKRYGWPLVSN